MPTFVIWNIEEYGNYKASRGQNLAGVNQFIARLMKEVSADVLLIQEFKESGTQPLANLCQVMNHIVGGNWQYDYVEGALRQVDPPVTTWGSNSEGYAVLWKDGTLSAIQGALSQRASDGSPGFISLVLEGATPTIEYQERVSYAYHRDNPIGPLGFPYATRSKQLRQSQRAAFLRRADEFAEQQKQDYLANMQEVYARRPCFIQYQPRKGTPLKALAYHAPIERQSGFYGMQLFGLSSQVVESRDSKLVVGGDFNIISSDRRTTALTNLTDQNVDLCGAGNQPSTVHYNDPGSLQSPNNTGLLLGSARDQALTRSLFNPSQAPVWQLFDDLAGQFATEVLADGHISAMVQNHPPMKYPGQAWDAALQNLRACFANGHFDSDLSRAMFFRGYISDHLPLVVSYTR